MLLFCLATLEDLLHVEFSICAFGSLMARVWNSLLVNWPFLKYFPMLVRGFIHMKKLKWANLGSIW